MKELFKVSKFRGFIINNYLSHQGRPIPVGSDSKESAHNVEARVQSLDQVDPVEKGMATHSSTLAWEIPWTEELGGLRPQGGSELDTTETT